MDGKMERPYPDTIPRQEEFSAPGVPDRQGELAVETGQAGRSLLLEEMEDDLRVGVCAKPVAPGNKPLPQFRIVEDLPVVYDRKGFVLVVDGLVASSEINDA